MATRLPASLELDTHDGSTWLSVVPFTNNAVRLKGLPSALGVSLPEINVRTYVTREGVYRNSRQSVRGRTEIEDFRDDRWTPSTEPASGRCPRAVDERFRLSNHSTPSSSHRGPGRDTALRDCESRALDAVPRRDDCRDRHPAPCRGVRTPGRGAGVLRNIRGESLAFRRGGDQWWDNSGRTAQIISTRPDNTDEKLCTDKDTTARR